MIAIIDYGMGNLYSVEKAFVKLGAEVVVTSEPKIVAAADKVVLPGVGAFGDCMENLNAYHMIDAIHEVVAKGTPFLSICLGLQVLLKAVKKTRKRKGWDFFLVWYVKYRLLL